jgi:3-hydroxyacyl-CoA dehydrogenase
MQKPIRRTAVIGAGIMGSGIAAHFANAGLEVLLLDIVPPASTGLKDRDAFAKGGLEKALKARPAAFFHKDNARLVKTGNVEDHLDKLKD